MRGRFTTGIAGAVSVTTVSVRTLALAVMARPRSARGPALPRPRGKTAGWRESNSRASEDQLPETAGASPRRGSIRTRTARWPTRPTAAASRSTGTRTLRPSAESRYRCARWRWSFGRRPIHRTPPLSTRALVMFRLTVSVECLARTPRVPGALAYGTLPAITARLTDAAC